MPAPKRLATVKNLASAVRVAIRPGGPSLVERVHAVPRMVRATVRGQYPGTSVGRLLALAAAAGYVLSPIDLVPELFAPLLGLTDDAMVMSWLAAQLVAETEDFLLWEKGAGRFAGADAGGAPGARAGRDAGAGTGRGAGAGAGDGWSAGRDGGTSAAAGQTVPGHVVR
jgi:uncharacterized membrane protein YkvA (DUF1232 family)